MVTDERLMPEDVRAVVAAAVEDAVARVEAAHSADTRQVLDRVAALEGRLALDAEARQTHTDGLRKAAAAVHQALAQVEAARSADAISLERSLAQIEGAWATDAAKIQRALARIEAARAADTTRLHKQIATLVEPAGVDGSGQAQLDEIRTAVLATTEEAIAQAEAARSADADRLGGQVSTLAAALTVEAEARRAEADELRTAVAATVEQAIAAAEASRAADTARLLDQVAALQRSPTVEAGALQDQIDEARQTITALLDQVTTRIEALHGPDAAALLEELSALAGRAASDVQRRDEQGEALVAAVDERLQSLHATTGQEADARADRLAERLEANNANHAAAVLARLDERVAGLATLVPEVAAQVNEATAAALSNYADQLGTRLQEATDAVTDQWGRIEALARARIDEARAAEERLAALLIDVAERAEKAVDRSRARIAEGQVALNARIESATSALLQALGDATVRLESGLVANVEGMRATGGHQDEALLEALEGSGRELAESLAEVKAAIAATAPAQAAHRAELAESLAEVKAAIAATAPGEAAQRAELAGAVEKLRATVESLRQDSRLDVLIDEQTAARQAQLAAVDRVRSRVDELGPVVAQALLSEVERAVRSATAVEADALADLRASQAAVREAVQVGVQKAELAALDIRGLRDRLTPHLMALAEATTRRAEADQAGFDAVLARLDSLLTARRD